MCDTNELLYKGHHTQLYLCPTVPTFDDEKDLPLVLAFFQEVFRWRPVSYGGMT